VREELGRDVAVGVSSGASSIVTTPFCPSITSTTSRAALPLISSASNPENFMRGPKYPPTLLSMGMPVSGESVTTSDLPEPAYWVLPERGPGEMTITFSGSFHFVAGVMACQR